MHKYFFHIGDFNRATRHLSRLERSVYRDLIDLYMETELPLDSDIPRLCRKIIATSQQESTAVEQVLNEFFILTANGYVNMRCDTEILSYKNNTSQKSIAGKASAEAKSLRKQQLKQVNGCSTDVEHTFNGTSTERQLTNNLKPLTNNQEPLLKAESKAIVAPKARPSKRPPSDFTITPAMAEWAKSTGIDFATFTRETESFKDHEFATAKTDWVATWRNWMRRGNRNQSQTKKPIQGASDRVMENFRQNQTRGIECQP